MARPALPALPVVRRAFEPVLQALEVARPESPSVPQVRQIAGRGPGQPVLKAAPELTGRSLVLGELALRELGRLELVRQEFAREPRARAMPR